MRSKNMRFGNIEFNVVHDHNGTSIFLSGTDVTHEVKEQIGKEAFDDIKADLYSDRRNPDFVYDSWRDSQLEVAAV